MCLYRPTGHTKKDLGGGGSLEATAAAVGSTTNTLTGSSSASGSGAAAAVATTGTPTGSGSGGLDAWLYQETGEATLCVQAEVSKQNKVPRVLLRTRILLREAYQRQGDNIITWCEPYYGNASASSATAGNNNSSGNARPQSPSSSSASTTTTGPAAAVVGHDPSVSNGGATGALPSSSSSSGGSSGSTSASGGVDLALSFQDNAGCLDIWRQITHVQARAAELVRQRQHHDLQQQLILQHQQHQQQQQQQQQHPLQQQQFQPQLEQQPSIGDSGATSVEGLAARAAAQHHADLQQQQQLQQDYWSVEDPFGRGGGTRGGGPGSADGSAGGTGSASSTTSTDAYAAGVLEAIQALPSPPTLHNLEIVADTIAALQHIQQREHLAMYIANDECAYLKALLELFPAAEERGDYGKLATLAACVKTILLLNDPSILELIVSYASMFEQVCSCLEYDPDLREKANHRWFLRERAKFRTVVPMQDPELVAAIHRTFRVQYLRDTLLRPTMDESSLSTLSSLQTFTHADVVKGVTMAGMEPDGSLFDSYLIKVIDMLCVELHVMSTMEWNELEAEHTNPGDATSASASATSVKHDPRTLVERDANANLVHSDRSILAVDKQRTMETGTWKQYLTPQDGSLPSRRMRRAGCISFLKELFNMVRLSLQQSDKDDFFAVICTLEIDLNDAARELADNVSQTSQNVEVGSVASTIKSDRVDEKSDAYHNVPLTDVAPPPTTLLSMLGCVLVDPNVDVSEKGTVLEILSGVVMHDPDLVRRHALDFHAAQKTLAGRGLRRGLSSRPVSNETNQVLFLCPASDLLSSLLFLLNSSTDAGILLQVSEILRIVLDTDMLSDRPLNAAFDDDAEDINSMSPGQFHAQDQLQRGQLPSNNDQKLFLSLFYEHYIEWLVAPFQFTLLHPVRRVPEHLIHGESESVLLQHILSSFQRGAAPNDPLITTVSFCATRSSFAVELLSFCVRAHLYRMKFYLLKSRVTADILKLLRPTFSQGVPGIRCLKLSALRFLRSILSVNDDLYRRHIILQDLFAPVFEALRANPVGDNLVSSAIVEMCDFIHKENIKSLIEYIVTKHLSAKEPEYTVPSLEDVSSPYVSTLTVLRQTYESNLNSSKVDGASSMGSPSQFGSRYFSSETAGSSHAEQEYSSQTKYFQGRKLSGKALEDQRKFRAADDDESYFESDENDDRETTGLPRDVTALRNRFVSGPTEIPDDVPRQQLEGELHRTPRMFSLSQQQYFMSQVENAASSAMSDSQVEK